jgi:hypothetical protein
LIVAASVCTVWFELAMAGSASTVVEAAGVDGYTTVFVSLSPPVFWCQ